jgi:hypothetical protein
MPEIPELMLIIKTAEEELTTLNQFQVLSLVKNFCRIIQTGSENAID